MRRAFAVAVVFASVAGFAAESSGPAGRGRALLRLGRVSEAERVAATALQSHPDDSVWCLEGEVRFRRGDFEGAGRAFETALASNPDNARAWWGLGRIEQLHFRPAARDLFAKAYQRDPRDPEIILSYLDFVQDPASRAVLLRNAAMLARSSMPERAEHTVARLKLEAYLEGRQPADLASPYTEYKIPLSAFHPSDAAQHGLIVTARFNGGRRVRLVLDTGARGILLHQSAARGLGLEALATATISGFGEDDALPANLMLARRVAFEKLEFRDCPVQVVRREITPGADGILGASLFERFRLRIDPHSRLLELTPGDETGPADMPRAVGLDRLLLVRANIDRGGDGWFLLDTGAAYTALSPSLSAPRSLPQRLGLNGMQGAAGALRLAPVGLRIGGRELAEREPVALDLAAISQREGVEISGILGYSTLSQWPVTIDFRSGLVRFGGH
jgi:tetratricopeptide (TPR) repeat protein